MSWPFNYPPSHVFQLRNERKILCFLSDDHCDLFPLASLSWKHGLKDSSKDSSPVHARANSSQYIHHTFFASPPCSKLDAMPYSVHCTSNVFDIETKAKQTFDPRNFSLSERNEPAFTTIFSRSKRNESLILVIFDFETKRTILFLNFSRSKQNRPI